MFEHTFLFVGALCVLSTMGAMTASVDRATRVLSGVVSMILWGIWSLRSQSVTREIGGEAVTHSYQDLSYIALAVAAIMLVVVITQSLKLLQEGDD